MTKSSYYYIDKGNKVGKIYHLDAKAQYEVKAIYNLQRSINRPVGQSQSPNTKSKHKDVQKMFY